jgi:hypothetical protein
MQSEVICRCDVLGTSILSTLYLLVIYVVYRVFEWKIARRLPSPREVRAQAAQQHHPAAPATATTVAAAVTEAGAAADDDGLPSIASLTRDNEQAQALVKSLATTFSHFVDENSRAPSRKSPAKDTAPAAASSSPRDKPPTEAERRRRDRIAKRRRAPEPVPTEEVAVTVVVDERPIARFAGGEDEELSHEDMATGEQQEQEEDEDARLEELAGAIGWEG